MSAQFTKGPWSTGPAHVVAQRTIDDQGRRVTRFVAEAVLSAPIVEGEREANANLIAAAPELYEALDAMVDEHDDWPEAVAAKAALAKARGETSE